MKFKQTIENKFGDDPKFTVIPLQVGGRYYFLLESFRPYLLAMSGFNIISQKYSYEGATIDTTSSHLNFQIGLGIDVMIISQLGLDIHAMYNSHLFDFNAAYNLTGLEYGVGIKWKFGSE